LVVFPDIVQFVMIGDEFWHRIPPPPLSPPPPSAVLFVMLQFVMVGEDPSQ
jgi:hypothetical protein